MFYKLCPPLVGFWCDEKLGPSLSHYAPKHNINHQAPHSLNLVKQGVPEN